MAQRRFAFGKNWSKFAQNVSGEHLQEAEQSLKTLLAVSDLSNKTFLDIGCGSGLFSVAASGLGAEVTAFDFDADSVSTSEFLAERLNRPIHRLSRGDVLDPDFMNRLGQFDIVYSWGVLHHTGALWHAIEHAAGCVAPDGLFAIALYNDQGWVSRVWRTVKRAYVGAPKFLRAVIVAGIIVPYEGALFARDLAKFRPHDFFSRWTDYRAKRGMSRIHDHIDWIGGYPFEVAKPKDVVAFVEAFGFHLQRMTTIHGHGNNEFVFVRSVS